jgi:hypothetical protein
MARKRTFSHFFFEKKCVFVPKSLIWLPREGRDVLVRVSHPTSGIFIHKGRKIVMK